jgi:membrane fusion protein (multidrug efflux system)
VQPEAATHYGEYAGRVFGSREVEIRAQVSGILQERRYNEGDPVAAGQTLFLIDPEPYRLDLRAAEAELTDARALLTHAEREWQRVAALYENNAVSARERDQAETARLTAEARLNQAQVRRDDAERNLRYTRVESPIAGIAGIEEQSEGNLISAAALLTNVIQTDPVHIHFSLPENEAQIQRDALQQAGSSPATTTAWIRLADGSDYAHAGEVTFNDSRINPATASIAMRATFANPAGRLVAGQFLRVRLVLREFDQVFLIAPEAVSQGPQGPQVYLVKETTATTRQVTLGPVIDGRQVILAGLDAGDLLVVNGHVALSDGATVEVTNSAAGDN